MPAQFAPGILLWLLGLPASSHETLMDDADMEPSLLDLWTSGNGPVSTDWTCNVLFGQRAHMQLPELDGLLSIKGHCIQALCNSTEGVS